MVDIGTTLRETRERYGLSLNEAAAATRIRERFVQALEENDFAALGGDVYVRGFLRNYANFLELDPEPMLAQLGLRANAVATPTPAGSGYMSEALQSRAFPLGRVLAMVLLLLVLGGVAYTLWAQPDQRDALLARFGWRLPNPTVAASASVPGATPSTSVTQTVLSSIPLRSPTVGNVPSPVPTATLPPRTPTPNLTPTITPEATLTPTLTAVPVQEAIALSVQVLDRAWTEVYVDGQEQPLVYRILEPGEQLEWTAESEIFLRSGNAGGLQLTLNGQDLGVLGRAGGLSVRRWQRSPDGGAPQLVETLDR